MPNKRNEGGWWHKMLILAVSLCANGLLKPVTVGPKPQSYVTFKSSQLAFVQLFWTGAGVPGLTVSLQVPIFSLGLSFNTEPSPTPLRPGSASKEDLPLPRG